MIYIFVFAISLIFFKLALKFREKNNFLFVIFSTVAIFLPCFLATFRDDKIGVDVNVYVMPLFKNALRYNSFFEFIKYKNSSVSDILYLFTTYFCSKITSEHFLLFFLNEALVITPIYLACLKKFSKEKNNFILLSMFIFFTFFYNQTFNMVRQSISLAFSILAFSHLEKNENKKAYLNYLVAFFFHNSAIINLFIIIFYKFMKRIKSDIKLSFLSKTFILTLTILSVFSLRKIVIFLSSIGIFSNKFNSMLISSSNYDFSTINFLFYLSIFLLIVFNKNKLSENMDYEIEYKFFSFMSILSIIILQMGMFIKFSNRIGYYAFYLVLFLFIPKLAVNKKYFSKKQLINTLIIVIIFISYWLFWIVKLNYNNTYPYVFWN